MMPTSRDLPADRLAIGQLLVRLLRQFRAELFEPAAGHGYSDLREPHLHIFGNLGVDGVRLTDLAARAQLSLATTSELVTDLQQLGYLERRADGSDRRAKLIFPTTRGRRALDDAGDRVAQIEEHWSQIVGPARFADACRTLQDLLDALTSSNDGA
jgi:DNA-binding MarR family transcriptional regulator